MSATDAADVDTQLNETNATARAVAASRLSALCFSLSQGEPTDPAKAALRAEAVALVLAQGACVCVRGV